MAPGVARVFVTLPMPHATHAVDEFLSVSKRPGAHAEQCVAPDTINICVRVGVVVGNDVGAAEDEVEDKVGGDAGDDIGDGGSTQCKITKNIFLENSDILRKY